MQQDQGSANLYLLPLIDLLHTNWNNEKDIDRPASQLYKYLHIHVQQNNESAGHTAGVNFILSKPGISNIGNWTCYANFLN